MFPDAVAHIGTGDVLGVHVRPGIMVISCDQAALRAS